MIPRFPDAKPTGSSSDERKSETRRADPRAAGFVEKGSFSP
jgi:hypothetical protein